jgi:hypothetical protein
MAARDQAVNGGEVEELEPFRLLERPGEHSLRNHFGQVEERARDARDGDGVSFGAVFVVKPPSMKSDAAATMRPLRRGDVNPR